MYTDHNEQIIDPGRTGVGSSRQAAMRPHGALVHPTSGVLPGRPSDSRATSHFQVFSVSVV